MKREVEDAPAMAVEWKVTIWLYFTLTALVVFLLGYSVGAGDADIDERLDRIESIKCIE